MPQAAARCASPQLRFAYTLAEPPTFECTFPGCGRVMKNATALRLHEQLHVDDDDDEVGMGWLFYFYFIEFE